MKKMSKTSTLLLLGIFLISYIGCSKKNKSEAEGTYKTYEWKMVTSWQANFPILGEGATQIADMVEEMSQGQLKIKVYGSGELIPGLGVFDAVSEGTVQMGHSSAYYWSGKVPEAVFFSSIPFGLLPSQLNAWMLGGDGMKLWREVYAKHGVVPFMAGNTGVQMGGWFRKEINLLKDFSGLKMRIPGLGGKLVAAVGGSAVTVASGEIYTNLERGVIDATEWIGPYHDKLMGFDKVAKYYYYPGWHEPGTQFELIVNKKAYESLPKHLQKMVEVASMASHLWVSAQFQEKNAEYLDKIKSEGRVKIRKFSPEIIRALKSSFTGLLVKELEKHPEMGPIYDNFAQFKDKIEHWYDMTDANYVDWK